MQHHTHKGFVHIWESFYKCLRAKAVACCDVTANSGASLFMLIFQKWKQSAWWPPVCFLCLATYCCFSASKGLFKRLFILSDMGYLKKCKWDSQDHRSLDQPIVNRGRWMFPWEDYKAHESTVGHGNVSWASVSVLWGDCLPHLKLIYVIISISA